MSGIRKRISLNNIVNYYENPRHAIALNERDTLIKLFNTVGFQYMLNLATDICQNGLIENQQIVVVYSDDLKKYVVYEGNRRIAALKLLLNPEYFDFLDKSFLDKIKDLKSGMNNKIKMFCVMLQIKKKLIS